MLKKIAFFSLIFMTSCQEKENNSRNNKTPKALQEDNIDFGRFRSNNDLVDDLYMELVDKSPELKKLETELEAIKNRDTLNLFNNYAQKSDDYYRSAKNKTGMIKDSVMKNKILSLIENSNEKYIEKTTELQKLVKTIHQKQNDINDYHTALKVILTIPLIEKYQNEHLPQKNPFEKIIEKENQLLEKVKKNTPKY